MKVSDSKYKNIIAEYFDYTFDFEFLDNVATIIDRIDNLEDTDDIYTCIYDALCWYNIQWRIAQHYCSSPAELNWSEIEDEFTSDIMELCRQIQNADEEIS